MGGGGIGAPFARLLANLIVMGSGVLGRAFMEAYKQALQNGGKAAAGAAAAGGKAAVDPFAAEARAILNIKPKASAEEVREAAERLAAMNDPAKGGSEYLRAKIHNARDALLKEEAPPKPPSDDANAPDSTASVSCDDTESDYLRDIQKLTGSTIEVMENHEWHFPAAIPSKDSKKKTQPSRHRKRAGTEKREGSRRPNKRRYRNQKPKR